MEEDCDPDIPPTDEEVEFAQTAARYDEVLSKCKLLRARLLMNSSSMSGNLAESSGSSSEIVDVIDSLDNMLEKFQRLSIHEEMLKEIKMSKLALDLFSGDGPFEGLDDLLKEHCANQATLFELAKKIRSEKVAQKKAIDELLDQLCQYTISLKADQVKLDGSSSADSQVNLELKKVIEKQIKEIRFMQICISQIISTKNIDLRKAGTIKKILKSVRIPITSVEYFI